MQTFATYATVDCLDALGPSADELPLDWTTFVGDETPPYEFDGPTAQPVDPYLTIQAFDVGAYGHEVLLNGDPLGGFDLPTGEGWCHWMDTVSNATLEQGTNTLQIRRDASTDDGFAVGTVVVHWREAIE